MRRIKVILIAAAALLSGCGSGSSTSTTPGAHHATTDTSLVLDFTPNAVHAGIYTAIARGYDTAAGVRLHVIVPSATTDSIKLLQSRRVNFAILDIHDLAIARERGADIVGIMAVVQRPLAAVIAAPSITTPRALEDKPVGITGVPSDTAVLDSIVSGAGGDPHEVRTVTIGFNAVTALLSGRVAGATAFWNDEGVTIARRRPGFRSFRVDDYGAPAYPELVVCATRATIARDPGLARAVARSLARGYDAVLANPRAGATALETRVPGLDPTLVSAQLTALLPAFRGPGGQVGVLDLARLDAWARWEARFGIVPHTPDVRTTFDPSVLGG